MADIVLKKFSIAQRFLFDNYHSEIVVVLSNFAPHG